MIVTGRPIVTLRNYFKDPFDSAMAAARTCYSPRVIGSDEISDKQRESISKTTFQGGHHTVFQHPHFEFGLENISRQLVWSLLHSFPFYNSEQQSQRFVRLDEARAFVPPLEGEERRIYEEAILRAWDYYRRLTELLRKDAFIILSDIRYLRPNSSPQRRKKVEREAEKKAIETARYVIPVAAFTSMVYTVSGIVLHRLRRMMLSGDTPYEARLVVSEMIERVREVDPLFFEKIGEPPLERHELPEFKLAGPTSDACAEKFCREFDQRLGGRISLLIDYSPAAEEIVADALRAVLGRTRAELSTDDALDLLLNPAKNVYRLDTLNVHPHSPAMRALNHAAYTFMKKISHTADSQDQRHRMVPASRPLMQLTDTRRPDYITPRLIRESPEAHALYREAMEAAWAAKNELLDRGVPPEYALYLLPNAKALRFVESGSLLYLLHKWTLRTCLNAQEEIFAASMEEIEQVGAVHPRLARYIGPPCVLRNRLIAPRCTEGDRFCGIPVWLYFPSIQRRI